MTQTTPSSVDAMRQALEDVCNPLGYLRRKAEAEGNRLGGMAYAIANDIATVQQIARDALSTLPSDGVTIPADGWRCFHCGEHFTSEQCARLHFGRDEMSDPACIIKAGAEGSLLKALRRAEEAADDAIQAMHAESTDAAKAYHAQRCRHTQALIAAEELGYERGLADGRALSARSGGVDPA